VIRFVVDLNAAAWNDAVVEVIGLGQNAANGWSLLGTVYDDLTGLVNHTKVSGVDLLQWNLREADEQVLDAEASDARM
jgi:hypothetical protein